jgi:alanyl-tRNA synthetase
MDKKALIDAANRLVKEPSVCVLGSAGDNFMLVIACHPNVHVDCASILKRTLEMVGGKGGGKPTFATGGVQGREQAERCMSNSIAEAIREIEKNTHH